jgi:hypothetical protein
MDQMNPVDQTQGPANNSSVTEDPFRMFPQGVRIIVDVVFPGEYRIGWEYKKHTAIPGTPRYFEFRKAADYALAWFKNSFPGEAESEK